MAAPRLIAVDIGNTSTKLGWFDDPSGVSSGLPSRLPKLAASQSFHTGQTPPEKLVAEWPPEPCTWSIASVNREGSRVLTNWLTSHRQADEVRLLSHRDLPIAVDVDFPDRVGLDRLAAAVAANAIREPGRPAIVIDAGSAVTVDLVTAAGAFAGGVILPGFRMSAEALFGGADLLPLAMLAPEAEVPAVVGKNTEAAIRSGLFWGAVGAVREIVTRMSAELASPPHVFVTGGDLRQLAEQLGNGATFVPNLVLCGIALAAAK
jgi:type III pantothenate kinase